MPRGGAQSFRGRLFFLFLLRFGRLCRRGRGFFVAAVIRQLLRRQLKADDDLVSGGLFGLRQRQPQAVLFGFKASPRFIEGNGSGKGLTLQDTLLGIQNSYKIWKLAALERCALCAAPCGKIQLQIKIHLRAVITAGTAVIIDARGDDAVRLGFFGVGLEIVKLRCTQHQTGVRAGGQRRGRLSGAACQQQKPRQQKGGKPHTRDGKYALRALRRKNHLWPPFIQLRQHNLPAAARQAGCRLDRPRRRAYISGMTANAPHKPDSSQKPALTILLAQPRGFCAGVERAIEIVEKSLQKFGAPVYVRHEIVHNKHVLDDLRAKGAVFVKELDEVPEGAPVIFSAHGVPKRVPDEAARRNMIYVDATCPLVSKVHREAELHHRNGCHIILIGHAGHPEVVGTMGQLPDGAVTLIESAADVEKLSFGSDVKLSYVTQTTLSVDDTADIVAALQMRYPDIAPPKKEDICYATTNRQLAVKDIAPRADAVIVIGSRNSSNSNRLVEVARAYGAKHAVLADKAEDIDWEALGDIRTLGLTAGASAPEVLVQGVIDAARARFSVTVQTAVVAEENIQFKIPRVLAT